MVPIPHVVVDRTRETADTTTIVLAPAAATPAAPAPGQFHMLWAFGTGEVPISISALSPDGAVAHTVRAVGAASAALAAAEPGDAVGVRGPFGTGWGIDASTGGDLVLVAGGIGLAPLRPVLRRVVADRGAFGRVAVLVGARTPDTVLYAAELARARAADIQVEVTVDHARRGWIGDVGVVTDHIARADVDAARTTAMVCGPEVMMRRAVSALLDRGVAAAGIEVSIERNMQCALGTCGHCQLGPAFVCRDGPVLRWPRVEPLLRVRER
jgi:anaerobic sulfite reductase subunit B